MGILMNKLRQATQKDVEKFGKREISTTLSTGFPTLDYFNAKITLDKTTNMSKLMAGINAGKPILITGPTSCGKSTFAYQLAINLTKPYPNGDILILDYENAFEDQRFLSMPGVT